MVTIGNANSNHNNNNNVAEAPDLTIVPVVDNAAILSILDDFDDAECDLNCEWRGHTPYALELYDFEFENNVPNGAKTVSQMLKHTAHALKNLWWNAATNMIGDKVKVENKRKQNCRRKSYLKFGKW